MLAEFRTECAGNLPTLHMVKCLQKRMFDGCSSQIPFRCVYRGFLPLYYRKGYVSDKTGTLEQITPAIEMRSLFCFILYLNR